jgi:hypothetical protein
MVYVLYAVNAMLLVLRPNRWNTLPQSVIDANDVRQFEIRLDEYWEHQDVKFEYKASIQNKENTGNHPEISCITEEVEVDIVAESQRPQMTYNLT